MNHLKWRMAPFFYECQQRCHTPANSTPGYSGDPHPAQGRTISIAPRRAPSCRLEVRRVTLEY